MRGHEFAGGGRFIALDSWRGLCAIAVALFHFPVAGAVKSFPIVAHAYLFVDFFFVLSGFVIAHAYERKLADGDEDQGSFILKRIGRIWPLHVAILLLLVVINVAQHDINIDEKHSVFAIFTNILMVQGLGIHHDLTWNGPSWSISVEMFLYLVFTIVAPLKERTMIYLTLMGVGLLVLTKWAPHGMASTFDFGIYRGLAGFFAGALLAKAPAIRWGALAEVATLAAVASFVALGRITILSPLVFSLAVYVFANSRGLLGRVLSLRPLVWVGERSYSIYMVHSIAVAAIWALATRLGLHRDGHLLAGPHGDLLAVPFLLAAVGMAAVTHPLIEQAGQRWFRRIPAMRYSTPSLEA